MAENKTQPTNDSVEDFINSIDHSKRREDSRVMLEIMSDATGAKPVLWGSIVGFGKNHYKYESGREGDIMAVGFAPRKQALTLYGLVYYERNRSALKDLGEHEMGKGCLYIKDLSKVSVPILRDMIKKSFDENNNAIE